MSDAPLISVVVPNYNHANYLPTALAALIAQTWTNIEIVVVDDGSTDNSCDVIADFARRDSRIRLVALPANLGVNRAIQEGVRTISGDYLYMASADDVVEPNFFEKTIGVLITAPAAAFCFSDPMELIDATGERRRFPLRLAERPVAFDPQSFADLLAANYFHISSQTILFRRAAFLDTGGYLPDLEWMADWFLNHVAAFRHGVCYLPESLCYLRIRADSIWAVSIRDAEARRRVLGRVLARLAEPAYADVRGRFRRAALLPEYHFSTLMWLLADPQGRSLITPRLVGRLINRSTWSFFRPAAPLWLRRKMRQVASAGWSGSGR